MMSTSPGGHRCAGSRVGCHAVVSWEIDINKSVVWVPAHGGPQLTYEKGEKRVIRNNVSVLNYKMFWFFLIHCF